MSTLFKDVFILDGGRERAERVHVLVSKGRIESIVPHDAPLPKADKIVVCNGKKALLPGFVNGHTHAAMCLLRGIGEDAPLMEWLEKKIWPVEEKLTAPLVRTGVELSLLEMARCGTTCYCDMYFEEEQAAEATVAMGMRAGLSRALMGDDQKRIDEGIELAEKWHGRSGLITVQLSPHAPYTVPFKQIKKLAAMAAERNLGYHVHLLETEWELSYFRDELKMTPEEWLSDSGILELQSAILAHSVWLDPALAAKLDFSHVTLVHNPNSNLKLGSGVFPLDKWLEAGVAVSLGTDSASSNNRLDMWNEMRVASLLQKGVFRDPMLGKASDVLRMATYDGALSLGFAKKGMIREGWVADFVLVDIDQPHYVGANEDNMSWFIVYAGSAADIEGTMVAGKWIYKEGEYPTVDADRIMSDAYAARHELVGDI